MPPLSRAALLALPLLAACGGLGALNLDTSNPNSVPASVDPASLATPAGELQIISMASRNACLRPQSGAGAQAQDVVGTGPCTGDAADSWRVLSNGTLSFGGTLCLTAAPTASTPGLQLASCTGEPNQQLTLSSGRLLLNASSGTGLAVAAGAGTPDTFVPAQGQTPGTIDDDVAQIWQLGLAQPGLSGEANVVVSGFPITVATSPTMCLTGQGVSVTVAACDGTASQQWLINETGGVQLGAYCLSSTTPGSIAQGTYSQFKLCRVDDDGQRWRIAQGIFMLQTYFLSPITMPPPATRSTPTVLTTSQVVWQLGG